MLYFLGVWRVPPSGCTCVHNLFLFWIFPKSQLKLFPKIVDKLSVLFYFLPEIFIVVVFRNTKKRSVILCSTYETEAKTLLYRRLVSGRKIQNYQGKEKLKEPACHIISTLNFISRNHNFNLSRHLPAQSQQ